MPSKKNQGDDPWWFSPTQFDVVAKAKVYRYLPYLLIQRVMKELAKTQYPTRPKRAKDTWIEPVRMEGTTYQLSCRIDEVNKKIVVTHIRFPKKMFGIRRHK